MDENAPSTANERHKSYCERLSLSLPLGLDCCGLFHIASLTSTLFRIRLCRPPFLLLLFSPPLFLLLCAKHLILSA